MREDTGVRERKDTGVGERGDTGVGETEREISIGKNKEYKKEKIFYMDVLKTIHKRERENHRKREAWWERGR